MRTFSLLKGLPVIEIKSGTKIGEVFDLSISSGGVVTGLIIRKGALLKKSLLLEVKNVSSFGWDGVMVETQQVLEPIKNMDEYTFDSHNRLTGKMMMTREGERLGLLEDVYFQEEVGTIVGYELSDGFFSDMLEGKRVVKTEAPPAIGKDAIIVNVKE
ncbi:PRC-barrel domain-containing protein [Bacillus sp. DTU_2020_1000418_1_SI_GHA_SEK_038]|uniref:PRC-barrel domain-containing protein n=1 Tax=Bacillus sp. DTU_2020_1000418_1_SI_GHA_SEK_038 TaxID=3077585 RepID=UPI0028E5300B|nr:PRC-barrel domain-containing protein [Bacillus sp. DTU_2020_1000418_1_SI_GHA_SEK_038]WNS74401.1 PRC-barrel domain-containing protein [Bacillus sp. DTU_2020_1000418_1_SI_GHA_SEK_038]